MELIDVAASQKLKAGALVVASQFSAWNEFTLIEIISVDELGYVCYEWLVHKGEQPKLPGGRVGAGAFCSWYKITW